MDAEKRLSQVVKDTNAAVAKANANMEEQIKVYQTKADSRIAVIERERDEAVVAAERARDEAITEAEKARSDSNLVVTQYGDMVADFERECTQRKKHLEEVAAGKVIAIKRQAQSLQKALAEGGQEYRKVISIRDAETEESINGLAIELSKMAAELSKQKALVAQLQAPKQFTQSTIEAQVGNRIQAFLSSRGVPLTCVDIGTRRYGEVPIYFEPIGCDVEDVEKQMEALYLHLGFNRMPSVSIENGKIKIVTQISSEVKPKADVIKRVSDTRLRQAFLDIPFGLRFTGYTGRGKSTLLNNVIHLYEDELRVRFTIFDPKTDFPSAKYPKNKVYRGTKRCLENISLIGSTVSTRQEYRVLNDEEGTPIPLTHQEPRLFLIDECKDIHDAAALADLDLKASERHYGKDFRFSVQKGLEVGRGLKVRVLYSTVTPDSSDFGFKNSVFKQSATVFLGDQCYEALGTKSQYLTTVSDVKKAQLRQEYEARVASTDERDKYIALFFNGLTNEVFFFSPPAPETWKIQFLQASDERIAHIPGSAQSSLEVPVNQDRPTSPALAQRRPAQNQPSASPASGRTLEAISEQGAECPDCHAISNSFKDRRVRKSDSTVRMRCNTKGCSSGGVFRAKVSE